MDAVVRRSGRSFQELADEAFKDLLKKHGQPVGVMASLEQSVGQRQKRARNTKKQSQS
jgi:hypothetical protein